MIRVKKTWLIDPSLVKRAQKIFGARTETETATETETETVTRSLQAIVVQDEIDQVFRKHSAVLADLEIAFPDRGQAKHARRP